MNSRNTTVHVTGESQPQPKLAMHACSAASCCKRDASVSVLTCFREIYTQNYLALHQGGVRPCKHSTSERSGDGARDEERMSKAERKCLSDFQWPMAFTNGCKLRLSTIL